MEPRITAEVLLAAPPLWQAAHVRCCRGGRLTASGRARRDGRLNPNQSSLTRGTSRRRHHHQKTTKKIKTARTVEVDGEQGEPDDVPDEERGGAGDQRRLAEHLGAHADEEDAPRDGLEHEQSGVFVAGRGAHSGGGGAVEDQAAEQELIDVLRAHPWGWGGRGER